VLEKDVRSMSGAAAPGPPAPSVARRVRWSAASSGLGLITSLGAYAVIGRLVDPGEYGRFAVMLATWGLFASAIDWCGNLMMRYGPIELGQRGSLRVTLSTRLVFAAASLVVLLPGAPAYLWWRGWPPARLAYTVGWLVAQTAFTVMQWSAVAAQRFRVLTAANVLQRACLPLTLLACAAGGRPIAADVLAVATLAGTLGAAGLLAVALRPLVGFSRPDRALFGAMWRYSLPSLLAAPSLAAMSYLDPILLARWASHADVGRYQLAYVTVTVFGALGAALNVVLSPELVSASAAGHHAAVEAYRRRDQPRLALGVGLGAFALACLAAPLARVVLPPAYAAAAEVIAVLCVAGGFMAGVWSFHPLVTVTESVWALQIATVLSAATNVALDVALAPAHGAIGIAFANVAAWVVQFAALALLLHRRIGARRIALGPLVVVGAAVSALVVAHAPRAVLGGAATLLSAVSLAALRIYFGGPGALARRPKKSRTA
jgi:O-antigen/teichoic acid export membrane protein